MLLGGATACICCIIRRVGLLRTLIFTLISLIIFMIIGLIANKLYINLKAEVEEQEKAKKEEEERLARIAEEEEEARRQAEEKLLMEQQEKEKESIAENVQPGNSRGNDDWDADTDTAGEEF